MTTTISTSTLSTSTTDRARVRTSIGDRARAVTARVRSYDRHLLITIAAAMNGCGITWGLPNHVDWAIDSIAPIGPLAYAHRMAIDGHWWSKYPPLHFAVLAAVDAPYLALLALRGTFHAGATEHPYGFTDPESALGVLTLIARLVSAAMATATAGIAYLIARELYGRTAGLIAGVLFVCSPLTVYYADTANVDVPYLFWSSAALLAIVRIARGVAPTRTYVAAGVWSALAVATKDQAYGLFLLLPIPLVLLARRAPAHVSMARLGAALAAATTTYAVAANVLVDPRGWWAHLRYITHDGSAPYRMFEPTIAGYAALAFRCVQLVADSMTWPVMAIGIAGAAWLVWSRAPAARLLVWALASYFASFIGAILYVFPRFVLPAVFVLSVFAGIASARAWQTERRLVRAAVVALIACVALYGMSMNLGLLLDSRYAAESWMAEHVPANAVVGMNGDPTYLPRVPRNTRTVAVVIDETGPQADGVAPDFVVLSDAFYRRYLRHENTRPVVHELLGGGFGYEPVAIFQRRGLVATDLIPTVNPRIVILRRRTPASPPT